MARKVIDIIYNLVRKRLTLKGDGTGITSLPRSDQVERGMQNVFKRLREGGYNPVSAEKVIKNEDDQFFSEKILDAMLVGCIPIYWTSSTDYLSDIFNMDGIFTFQKASQFYAGLEKNMFTKELYNNNSYS